MAKICALAFDEARRSSLIKIFAYVIMPDHYHVITSGERKAADVLRYLNGISARRIIDHLKENNFKSSLERLRKDGPAGKYQYSVWEHHSNTFLITSEAMLLQKVHYIHQNPVEAGLVEEAERFPFSSFRFWTQRQIDGEPLDVDIKDLSWRHSLR
jgi:REP element-mobilizing transposase RayT